MSTEVADQRLPVTVMSGYLGAGKTTLINHVLRHPQGLRLMVLVNDFGDINIDAELLESADEDTLQLSNGCVCCTLGGDLSQALWSVLERQPRPDHLLIEASGVAQPENIAHVALAEPRMRMNGIVTLVDALNFARLAEDGYIGAQVRQQIQAAHLLVVSRAGQVEADTLTALEAKLSALSGASCVRGLALDGQDEQMPLAELVLGLRMEVLPTACYQPAQHRHGQAYYTDSFRCEVAVSEQCFREWLAELPPEIYRLKGWVRLTGEYGLEVHVVGKHREVRRIRNPDGTALVAITIKNV